MLRVAVLMLALSSPLAFAGKKGGDPKDTGLQDTGDTWSEDTGDTWSEDTEGEDTDSLDTGTGGDSITQNPEVLGDVSDNTGTNGSPVTLTGAEESGCGGSMALLLLPVMLGWRLRRG